jgi:hypothetical protein
LLFILTYRPEKVWNQVHDREVIENRLDQLFRPFHDHGLKNGSFAVCRPAGKKTVSSEYRPFAVDGRHRFLGRQRWTRGGKEVERFISVVSLSYELNTSVYSCTIAPMDSVGSGSTRLLLPPPQATAPVVTPAGHRYGVFDLETIRSAAEVGGWNHADRMGISVGVIYDSADDNYHCYHDHQVPELVAHLQELDLVVGFNSSRFDYQVLSGYVGDAIYDLPTFDLHRQLVRRRGWKCDLNTLAHHTLGAKKSADGLLALQWYKEGRLQELADYCRKDVELTRDLYHHALAQGFVWAEKEGQPVRCGVKGVAEALVN